MGGGLGARIAAAALAAGLPAGAAGAGAPGATVVSGEREVAIEYVLPAFDLRPDPDALPGGVTTLAPEVRGLRASLDPGLPSLPVESLLIALPPGARPVLRVEAASFHDIAGVWIEPAATTPVADPDDPDRLVHRAVPDAKAYSADAFLPAEVARIGSVGVARDVDVAQVLIQPFRWNPARRVLRVYDRISIRIDLAGVKTTSGPGVRAGSGIRERSGSRARPAAGGGGNDFAFANGPVPEAWRVRREPQELARIESRANPAATGEGYRLEVAGDGLYRVGFEDLAAAGFPAAPGPIADLRLELRGERVPIEVLDGDGDGRFGPGDALLFHGLANRERWSATHVYWLTRSGGGLRMAPRDAFPPAARDWPAVRSTRESVRLEQNEVLFSLTPYPVDDWNPWLYAFKIRSGDASCSLGPTPFMDVPVDLPRLAPPVAGRDYRIRGQILGRKIVGTCNPDAQHLDVLVNGTPAGSVTWDAAADGLLRAFELPLDPAGLRETGNVIRLDQPVLPGTLRWSHLDWLEVEYERRLEPSQGVLELTGTWPAGATFYLHGFDHAGVEVVDVRSDGRVDRLLGVRAISLGPGMPLTLAFALPPEAGVTHRVSVTAREALGTPRVSRDTASDLRAAGNRAEWLAVSHGDFLAAIDRLATHRRGAGTESLVIDVQDVYDEFSWGNVDARAIRDFLALALARWELPPLYVALVGDSTQDFKNELGVAAQLMFVPHLEHVFTFPASPTGILIEGDSPYQTLVGGPSDPFPDLLLGRIPADSVGEVDRYVTKVIDYENRPPATWNGRYLVFLDDNIDTADSFVTCPTRNAAAEDFVIALSSCYLEQGGAHPGLRLVQERLYAPPNAAEGQQVLIDARNQGVSMTAYLGHGAVSELGIKCGIGPPPLYFFGSSVLPRLTNTEAVPLSTTVSCDVAWFSFQTASLLRSMGEAFTVGASTGDLAFIGSTTGISEPAGRGQLEGYMDGLFRPGSPFLPPFSADPGLRRRAGAIHYASQAGLLANPRIGDAVYRERDMRALALLGDPAARLRIDDPPVPPAAVCP